MCRIFLSAVFLFISSTAYPQEIKDYKTLFAICSLKNIKAIDYITLRQFTKNNKKYYLVVNPDNLATSLEPEDNLNIREYPYEEIKNRLNASAYFNSIDRAGKNSKRISDAGITNINKADGFCLTIDLCPSIHKLDRDIFIELVNTFKDKPVSVAISLSGIWIEKHTDDLNWLIQQQKENTLSITWINHSYKHRSTDDMQLQNNFLLKQGTDLDYEIMRTEQKMIQCGIVPSVFFRFPGLVSDKKIFSWVLSYGLIPVGADAWLGKQEKPKNGSIILVHANGNERIGIERFFRYLARKKNDIKNKRWFLYDLRQGIADMDASK